MMIAFEVRVNGNKLCDAGIGGLGVLSAILTWAHRVAESAAESTESYSPDELSLEVGGLKNEPDGVPGQQMLWLKKNLQVGDAIVINIKNVETVDPPESLFPEDPLELVREAKRRYFEELKKEFG